MLGVEGGDRCCLLNTFIQATVPPLHNHHTHHAHHTLSRRCGLQVREAIETLPHIEMQATIQPITRTGLRP